MSARIACRTGMSLLNHATIIGLSVALAVGFLGLSPRPAAAATFTPVIESFNVVRDNVTFIEGFDNNIFPMGEPGYSVTGPGGMTSESDSRLTMTPALGAPSGGSGNANTITRALRLATTNPISNQHLGQGNKVQVLGLFNIALPNTLPTINGQSFGIRLQDGTLANQFYPAGSLTNDIASLDVGRDAAGQLRIRFSELDLVANKNQTVATYVLPSLAGAMFIELILTKDANSANPTASFRILDAAMTGALIAMSDNINDVTGLPVSLYNGGELFTRGAFYSTDAVPLPAALPLFATVLAGGGLMAWRRRRKAARQHASAAARS